MFDNEGRRLAESSTQVKRKSDSRKSKAMSTWLDNTANRGCTLPFVLEAVSFSKVVILRNADVTRASTSTRDSDKTTRIDETTAKICFTA
jgi:hypothetical protein